MNVKQFLILAGLFLIVCAGWTWADTYHYSDKIEIDGVEVLKEGDLAVWDDSQSANNKSLTDLLRGYSTNFYQNGNAVMDSTDNTTMTSFVTEYVDDAIIISDNQYYSLSTGLNSTSQEALLDHSRISISNITVNNQTWLSFDGVDDSVQIDNSFSLNATNFSEALSICTWIYLDSAKAYQEIIAKGQTNTGSPFSNSEWFIGADSGGTTKFSIISNSNSETQLNFNKVIGSWFHICVSTVFDDSTDNLNIYKGGVSNAATSFSGSLKNNNQDICIGCDIKRLTDDRFYLNGSLNDIRIYNYEIDSTKAYNIHRITQNTHSEDIYIPEFSYHHIDDVDSEYYTTVANFTAQMAFLYDNGHHTITYKNLYDWQNDNFEMPNKPVILSFDDGYTNQFTNATPILDAYGFVGTSNIISSRVASNTAYMTWDQIQELHHKGWEITSHSVSHTDMETLSVSERSAEYINSKATIESNLEGVTVTSFIYPYNNQNSTLLTECLLTYTICTGLSRTLDSDYKYIYIDSSVGASQIYRISIRGSTELEDFKKAADINYNIKLKMKFFENTGTVLNDISGNNNNGFINGSTWVNDSISVTMPSTAYSLSSSNVLTLNNLRYDNLYALVSYTKDRHLLQSGSTTTQSGILYYDESGNMWCSRVWSDGVQNATSGAC